MNQVDPQEEPSMEEILASIRRIITEERKPPVKSVTSFDVSSEEEDVLDLPLSRSNETTTSPRSWEKPIKSSSGYETRISQEEDFEEDASSLRKKSNSVRPSSREREKPFVSSRPLRREGTASRTLEDLFLEALQPLIREWLDHHMPSLAKRIASEQIEEILYQKIFK